MEQIQEFFAFLLNSEELVRVGGLTVITIIVFCETGLFFAFFLPGDYLLFSAGLLTATGVLPASIYTLLICLFCAAVMGNVMGFLFGRFLGHKLETMRESFFYKKEYVRNTEKAFTKYGGRALIVGRFLPIVRTFAPIIAGAIKMKTQTFVLYNLVGAALWVSILTLSGYFLGREFPQIVNYIEYIILAFIAFTSVVLIRTMFSLRSKPTPHKQHQSAEPAESVQP
jgi:membrane-associated protein